MARHNVMMLGAPELTPESQAKVDAALAAIEAVLKQDDAVDVWASMALLQMRASTLFADPMLQLSVFGLRQQGRLRIVGER